MKKISLRAIIMFTAIMYMGCEREYYKPIIIEDTIRFATDIQPMLTSNCASVSSCHTGASPAKGLNLEEGKAYGEITSKLLVDTANAESSILYVKINSGSMKSYSTPEFTAKVLLWIKQGAQNN